MHTLSMLTITYNKYSVLNRCYNKNSVIKRVKYCNQSFQPFETHHCFHVSHVSFINLTNYLNLFMHHQQFIFTVFHWNIFLWKAKVLLLILSLNGSIISQRYLTLSDPWKLDGSRTFTRVLWRECRLMRHRYLEEIIDPIQAIEKTRVSNVNKRQCLNFAKDDNLSCSNNREDHLSSTNRE